MKLSTCTNLLLGGIATMAFNSFTSTPTFFVMARGSKDQKGTVASRGPKVTKVPNVSSRGPKETKAPNNASRGPKETKAPNASIRGLKETKAPNASRGPKATKAPNDASRGLKETKSPNDASRGPKATKAPNDASRGLKETKAPNVASRGPKATKAPNASRGPRLLEKFSSKALKKSAKSTSSLKTRGSKGGKGSGYYGGKGKGGKGSKGGYYSDNNDMCWFDDLASSFNNNIPKQEISECVSTYNDNKSPNWKLEVEGFLTCKEDPMTELYDMDCYTSEADICDEELYSSVTTSVNDLYNCVYYAFEGGYCFVNDKETPPAFYGCVRKFTDGFEDLSFDDFIDCTVSIENVFEEKCPYFLLDGYNEYNPATNVPTNFPDNFAACKALDQCANSVYTIDECFGYDSITMEEMLEYMPIIDVDVESVMNAINDENYVYVSDVFKEIITYYGTENYVTQADPTIQNFIMCIAENFLL